jgi:hypothetical protein
MNEAEAWEYLAERWDKASPYTEEVPYVAVIVDHHSSFGLCYSVVMLDRKKVVDAHTFLEMWVRMGEHLPPSRHTDPVMFGYCWSFTKRGARARARFCRKMAKIAGQEA